MTGGTPAGGETPGGGDRVVVHLHPHAGPDAARATDAARAEYPAAQSALQSVMHSLSTGRWELAHDRIDEFVRSDDGARATALWSHTVQMAAQTVHALAPAPCGHPEHQLIGVLPIGGTPDDAAAAQAVSFGVTEDWDAVVDVATAHIRQAMIAGLDETTAVVRLCTAAVELLHDLLRRLTAGR